MNIEKGTAYEIYINNYLNNIDANNIAWLWKDTPYQDLRKAGILGDWNIYRINKKRLLNNTTENENENSLQDTGIDILLLNNDKYYIVQCKNYDAKNYVNMESLAGFYMMIIHYDLNGILYYTSKLSHNILSQKPTEKVKFIHKIFENEPIYIENNLNNVNNVNIKNEYSNLLETPFDYQIEAYNIITKVFETKKRAILHLPCGMGKTLTSMKIGLDYDQIVIVSPLREYCIQNLERFKSEFKYKDYTGLIIDTDGLRDETKILDFIKKNKKIILSVCYKSCDILSKVLANLSKHIILIDEFHNISKNDVMGLNENGMYDILMSNSKILFMSATPKIFTIDDDDIENLELNEDIFGTIEYKYDMGLAIKNNLICDYEIYIPDIEINTSGFINDIKTEIDIKSLEDYILIESEFSIRGMLETGVRKKIFYAKTHEEAYKFRDALSIIGKDYYSIDIYVDTILSSDTKISRKDKLNKFKNFDGLSIIVNVEILNECIDIVKCDSIFMSSLSKSLTKVIQRFSRANRKDKDNIHKISKIFIWANKYEEIIDTIMNLKEFDTSFTCSKVKIFSFNNNNQQILERSKNEIKYTKLDNFIVHIHKVLTWEEKFDNLINYIEQNKSFPSPHSENIFIKTLGIFQKVHNKSYKENIKLMKNKKYYDIWTQFLEKYVQYKQDNEKRWISILDKVKQFMENNNDSPSRYAKNANSKLNNELSEDTTDIDTYYNIESNLGSWVANQKENYKKHTKMFSCKTVNGININNHDIIVQLWTQFNIEYKKYLLTNEENWYTTLDDLKNYIKQNNKRPSEHSKDAKIKHLALFVATQTKNYKNRTQIMSDETIYNTWTLFMDEYMDKFKSLDEKWYDRLDDLEHFIETYKRRPNKHSTNVDEKSIAEWLVKQSAKYRNKSFKSEQIHNDFEKVVSKI